MSKEQENTNMQLWNEVSKTNPAHTKNVKFGRAITAIDPYRQVEAATKAFGPAGQGWGWDVKKVEYTTTNQVAILVSMWVEQLGDKTDKRIEQWGQSALYIDKAEAKKDEDCFKKATTDGLTKCLSYMGFNADIFLGKFDDNKYVNQMKEEFSAPKEPPVDVIGELVKLGMDKAKVEAIQDLGGFTDQILSNRWASNQEGVIKHFTEQLEAK